MSEFPDHYAVLGIRRTADQEVIAAAYRALAKKFHPDTAKVADEASAERFRAVQRAYDVLGKPESRRDYDAVRAAEGVERLDGGAAAPALAGDAEWRPVAREGAVLAGERAVPGPYPHSTRPRQTEFRAEPRGGEPVPEEGGGAFRLALIAALSCFIAAGALLILWPSISGSFTGAEGTGQALTPPPLPEQQDAADRQEVPEQQNVTEAAKSDSDSGGDVTDVAIPEESELPAAEPKVAAKPKPTVIQPEPKVQPEAVQQDDEAATLYALTMRQVSRGVATTLADGTLTFNSRRACEDFARQARDRRFDAAVLETGEQPEISWECRGR
jgi:hypothetical protein